MEKTNIVDDELQEKVSSKGRVSCDPGFVQFPDDNDDSRIEEVYNDVGNTTQGNSGGFDREGLA